jgi:hypothetical protein
MNDSSPIISPKFLPLMDDDRPTAPRTKVITVLAVAAAFLLAAFLVRPYGAITGTLLVAAASVSFFAWKLYRKIGFAGDKELEEVDDKRDEYCV